MFQRKHIFHIFFRCELSHWHCCNFIWSSVRVYELHTMKSIRCLIENEASVKHSSCNQYIAFSWQLKNVVYNWILFFSKLRTILWFEAHQSSEKRIFFRISGKSNANLLIILLVISCVLWIVKKHSVVMCRIHMKQHPSAIFNFYSRRIFFAHIHKKLFVWFRRYFACKHCN